MGARAHARLLSVVGAARGGAHCTTPSQSVVPAKAGTQGRRRGSAGALVFTLAHNYGLYVQRASTATLVTTVLSVVTVTAALLLVPP